MALDCTSECEFETLIVMGGNYRQACLTCGMAGEWYRPDGTLDLAANIMQEAGLNPNGRICSLIRRQLGKLTTGIRDVEP